MARGPVEVLVFEFPVGGDPGRVTTAIRDVVERGLIRVVDLVLVLRHDVGGELDLRDLESGSPAELDWLALDPHTLLNDDDIALVADVLAPDQQAALLAVEHVWATDVAQRLRSLDGRLALHARVSPFEAEMAFAASAG